MVIGADETYPDDNEEQQTEAVAVKKCSNIFSRATSARRMMRELKIMRLMEHDNILSCKYVINPLLTVFNEIYIVSDQMESDLKYLMNQ